MKKTTVTEKENNVVYTKYTQSMKYTHKLLFPQMAPIHFKMLAEIMRQDGYDVDFLENKGAPVTEEGLQYVHNDACYPALLVIGQFIDALKSGKYDLNKTALIITQTGGGCRASNYIFLLRKALMRAGLSNIPVVSLNFSALEDSFKLTLPMIRKMVAALFYGDSLMSLSNQIRPYENNKGETDKLINYWTDKICSDFAHKRAVNKRDMKNIVYNIGESFSKIPVTKTPRKKVGIVGEIYVKFSPLGNNRLEEFLAEEGCEVNVPGLMGFIQYCIFNMLEDIVLYGGSRIKLFILKSILKYTCKREKMLAGIIGQFPALRPAGQFEHLIHLSEDIIGLGAKMGEGWLLTTEMIELVKSGFPNIVCAQPFGCLPNHIMGKGMISKIRAKYPEANIVPVDYDPSATRVNQINRIKLMLSEAAETLL